MGFFRKDPLEIEIQRLKEELLKAKTEVQREKIASNLERMIKLDNEQKSGRIRPTGDGVLKCIVAGGLALFGYYVESNGGIIPKWASRHNL